MDEIIHSKLRAYHRAAHDLAEACVAGSKYDHLRTVVDATEACLGVMERGDPYSPQRGRPSIDELLEAHAAHLRSMRRELPPSVRPKEWSWLEPKPFITRTYVDLLSTVLPQFLDRAKALPPVLDQPPPVPVFGLTYTNGIAPSCVFCSLQIPKKPFIVALGVTPSSSSLRPVHHYHPTCASFLTACGITECRTVCKALGVSGHCTRTI